MSEDHHLFPVTFIISCLEHSFFIFLAQIFKQLAQTSLSSLFHNSEYTLKGKRSPKYCVLFLMSFLQTSKDVSDVNGFDCDCKHGILHFPSSTALSVILYFPMNSLQFKRENICQRKLFFLYLCRYILFRPDVSQCPNQRLLQLSQRTLNTCSSKQNNINKLGNINSLQSFAEF